LHYRQHFLPFGSKIYSQHIKPAAQLENTP